MRLALASDSMLLAGIVSRLWFGEFAWWEACERITSWAGSVRPGVDGTCFEVGLFLVSTWARLMWD